MTALPPTSPRLTDSHSSAEHRAMALDGMQDLDRRAIETFARGAALERFRTYRLVVSGVQRLAAVHRLDAKIPITLEHISNEIDETAAISTTQ